MIHSIGGRKSKEVQNIFEKNIDVMEIYAIM